MVIHLCKIGFCQQLVSHQNKISPNQQKVPENVWFFNRERVLFFMKVETSRIRLKWGMDVLKATWFLFSLSRTFSTDGTQMEKSTDVLTSTSLLHLRPISHEEQQDFGFIRLRKSREVDVMEEEVGWRRWMGGCCRSMVELRFIFMVVHTQSRQ